MQQRRMEQHKLASLKRQRRDPVLDDLGHFLNMPRDIPVKPLNRLV